jgi:hypothetical protein
MRFKLKITGVLLLLYALPMFARAQQVLDIRGIIFKKNASERVAQALITDEKSQVVMMSDELGGFTIKASIGDTLLITKNNYAPEKVAVVNANDLIIYMQPVRQLKEVVIKEQSQKQELNEVMKQYGSQGIFNDGKSLPFWQFVNSPITGLYNLFGKTPARARRFAEFAKDEQQASVIDKRYTRELVKSITKLSDDDADKFMATYRPSYEDMTEWNDYQLIQYIKKEFAYYQKNKDRPEAKLQKLY